MMHYQKKKRPFYSNKEPIKMKRKSLLDRFLFLINSVLATALLLSYFLPFISPKTIPALAVLSLTVPFLIGFNGLFLIYWLIRLKRQVLLSAVVLGIGWLISSPIYQLTEKKVLLNDAIKIMSYNVRMFNHYKWSKDTSLAQKTFDFISKKKPDILALQEFYKSDEISFKFPYTYIKTKSKTNKFGLAIYSNYKIIQAGSLDFKNSANNAIFIDILKENDTIRVYNIHLESLKINPNKDNFGENSSEKLFGRLKNTFQKQAVQTELFLKHEQQWKGKKIICGDFNNTAFSWAYHKINQNKKDAFVEAGKGFGKTFKHPFPLRIDFILTDNSIEINNFKTFEVPYSDHYPILAQVRW